MEDRVKDREYFGSCLFITKIMPDIFAKTDIRTVYNSFVLRKTMNHKQRYFNFFSNLLFLAMVYQFPDQKSYDP